MFNQYGWILFGIFIWLPIVATNKLLWYLFPCEWSHPYGSRERQSARSR